MLISMPIILTILQFTMCCACIVLEFAKRRTEVRGAQKRKSAVKSENIQRLTWTKTIWSRGPRPKADGATVRDKSSPRRSPSSTGEGPLADGWNTKTQKKAGYVYIIICSGTGHSPHYSAIPTTQPFIKFSAAHT